MKFQIVLTLLAILHEVCSIVQIKLKKSTAKLHAEYLLSLKFMQISRNNDQKYSSFLEKEVPLHQQVLAQKRLATYYGDINVGYGRDGDPKKTQSFKMLFDTGSCEFWIPSKSCTTERCMTHTRYTKSNTWKEYHQAKMSIQYLSGKVTGDMNLETIGIGDLVVPDQVIGLADEVKIPLLDEVIWDGILGLAYPNKNLRSKGIKPIFDNIISQNILTKRGDKNQFAYYLGQERGAITFGGADMRFKWDKNEEFEWAPITEKSYWTISLFDIRKHRRNESAEAMNNRNPNDILCPAGCKAIVDTGTYLIYGPSDQLETFLKDMSITDCSQKHTLPDLGFMFKGFKKDGRDTYFELVLTPDDYVLEFEIDGKRDCVVGIGADTEDSGWTLGQVLLKTYYTVFDRDAEAVGFVRSNPEPEFPAGELADADLIDSHSLKNHTMYIVQPPINNAVQNTVPATPDQLISQHTQQMTQPIRNVENALNQGFHKAQIQQQVIPSRISIGASPTIQNPPVQINRPEVIQTAFAEGPADPFKLNQQPSDFSGISYSALENNLNKFQQTLEQKNYAASYLNNYNPLQSYSNDQVPLYNSFLRP